MLCSYLHYLDFFECINTFSLSLLTVTATSKVFISQFSLTVCVCEFEYLHEYLNMCAVCVPDRHIAVPYHTRTRTRNSCSSCLTFSQVGLATATCNMLISPSLAAFPPSLPSNCIYFWCESCLHINQALWHFPSSSVVVSVAFIEISTPTRRWQYNYTVFRHLNGHEIPLCDTFYIDESGAISICALNAF